MFSSEKSLQKRTIMDYLPEHQRAKVRKLVERLAQQTQQKQKYKKLYEQMTEKYQQLNKKYQDLEQHCSDLKSQIATSRMAINKAKQAYIASRSGKKMKKLQDNNNQLQNQNRLDTQTLKQTWMRIPKSYLNTKSSGEKQDRKQYIFQQNENIQSKSNFNLNSNQKIYPPLPLSQRFQQTSLKKTAPRKNYKESMIQSSSKKQEIINLRKQIESLTQQMKKKQTTGLPLNQKIKKCQQIKNRYLKSKQKIKKKKNDSSSQQNKSGDQSDDQSDKKSKSKSRITSYHKNKNIKSKKQLSRKQLEKLSHKQYSKEEKSSSKSEEEKDEHHQQQSQQQESQRVNRNKLKKSSNRQKEEKLQKKDLKMINTPNQQDSKNKKSSKQESKETFKSDRSKKQHRKVNTQNKFDQSLFAIINQLNAGN